MGHVTLTTPFKGCFVVGCKIWLFSSSRDIFGPQNLNGSRDLTTPLLGMICHTRLALTTINLSTKFEASISPTTKGGGQCHITRFYFRCPQSYSWKSYSESRQILYASRIYQILAWDDRLPINGRGQPSGWRDPFLNLAPVMYLESVKLGTSNVVCWLIQKCTSAAVHKWQITAEKYVFRVTWPF